MTQLLEKLSAKAKEASREVSVIVGYTAFYALFVHENMEMKLAGQPRPSGLGVYWGPSGAGPKFLERPARENGKKYGEMISRAIKQKKSMEIALLGAGLALQRDSQRLVPREYGFLIGSAFTIIFPDQPIPPPTFPPPRPPTPRKKP
jgi:hypothetical protein